MDKVKPVMSIEKSAIYICYGDKTCSVGKIRGDTNK